MSEDSTQNLTTDNKLDLILRCLGALEARSFDARLIREQTLKEIFETRQELVATRQELVATRAELSQQISELRGDVRQMSRKV